MRVKRILQIACSRTSTRCCTTASYSYTPTPSQGPSTSTRCVVRLLSEAHAAVSARLERRVRDAANHHASSSVSPSSDTQDAAASVWQFLSQCRHDADQVMLPRDPREIEDLPMLLSEALRGVRPVEEAPASEATLVEELEEWVLTSLPPRAMPAASGVEVETMSYMEWMSFLQSFVRYHTGVRWGASSEEGGDNSAAYYRRVYKMRPWHGLDCPDGRTAQMPYVHVLQWMLAGSPQTEGGDSQWDHQHRSTETFCPPSWKRGSAAPTGGRCFAALDVCSQSGYAVDLLLKAGASRVVAVDTMAMALGNTEATVHEHLRDRRSRSADTRRAVQVKRCELLPNAPAPLLQSAPSSSSAQTAAGTTASATTFASAAARRRRAAQQHRRGLDVAHASQPSDAGTPDSRTPHADVSSSDVFAGPFDVLYFHPPQPRWCPLSAVSVAPPQQSAWWRHVQSLCAAPFPWLLCPHRAAHDRHPHMTHYAVQQMVEELIADAKRDVPRLASGGYVVMVLPRTFDAGELLGAMPAGPPLSDVVVASLDGHYDAVLRRRHAGAGIPGDSLDWVRGLLKAASFSYSADAFDAYLREEAWVDVLVLRKRCAAAAREIKGNNTISSPPSSSYFSFPVGAMDDAPAGGVEWRDSFEYNEYKPKSAPTTRHHWTDLVPSYSYLEDDYYDAHDASSSSKVAGNFLAVGHTPALHRSADDDNDGAQNHASVPSAVAMQQAAANFKSVFADELRTRRRSKLRKLAMSPLAHQEWYIDEKLIKSEGAKVEFLNELSRWDFKDDD